MIFYLKQNTTFMLVAEYIQLIKNKFIKKLKLLSYIEDIVLYTHKQEVYKVVIRYNELLMKQLRKLGINYHIQIYTDDIPKAKITDDIVANCTKYENLTIIYNRLTQISTVVSGEERTRPLNHS